MTKINYDPDEECKQAVIFARVSSEEQRRGASLDAQVKTVKEYCSIKGFKLIAPPFQIVESSTHGYRKLFYQMLDFVKQQTHKTAICVNCIDRISRNYKEYNELDALREAGRIELHFYKEGLIIHKDSNSADISRWDFGILGAKMYVGNLTDNVKRSQLYKWEEGQYQSFAPIGYKNIRLGKSDSGKKVPKDIIVDEERAPKVQRLFEAYATGNHTLKDLYLMAKDMNLRSLYKKEQAKPLTIPNIQHMLKNCFYYGVMKVKKKYYPHKYPPLITKDLWDRVQDVMKGRARAPSHLSYGEKDYMFKGLVRCGTCGCLMTCETRTKKNGKKYNYLKCNHLKNNCHQKPINENTLIQQLKDEVFGELRISDNMLNNIKLAIRENMKKETYLNASIKRGLTNDIDELKAKQDRLLTALLDGDIDRETFKLKKAEYEGKIKELEESQSKYSTDNKGITDLLVQIADIAANAGKLFDSPIISKKREILKLVLSDSYVNEKKLYFSITKPFDKLFFSKGYKTWCRR